MTSNHLHDIDSKELADTAHEALRSGDGDRARMLFADAARLEEDAYDAVSEGKPRTLGILAVSAAALWFKAGDHRATERFTHRALANASLPAFAQRELHEVLKTIAPKQS